MSVQTYNAYDLFGDGAAPRVVLFTDHQSSLAEREQRINRLRELATDWIRDETHKRNCDHWYTSPGCVPSCTCGLSLLRAALATEGEKRE